MKDVIAVRHGTKRPAVSGVTKRASITRRQRGRRGNNKVKAKTESDVAEPDNTLLEEHIENDTDEQEDYSRHGRPHRRVLFPYRTCDERCHTHFFRIKT
jgi:hypothetical protein